MDEMTCKKMMERDLVSAVHAQERWLPDFPPLVATPTAGEVQHITHQQLYDLKLLGRSLLMRAFDADVVVCAYPIETGAFDETSGIYLPSTGTFYEPVDIPLAPRGIWVGNLDGTNATRTVFLASSLSNIGENQ